MRIVKFDLPHPIATPDVLIKTTRAARILSVGSYAGRVVLWVAEGADGSTRADRRIRQRLTGAAGYRDCSRQRLRGETL